jgi:hypothetical protein
MDKGEKSKMINCLIAFVHNHHNMLSLSLSLCSAATSVKNSLLLQKKERKKVKGFAANVTKEIILKSFKFHKL